MNDSSMISEIAEPYAQAYMALAKSNDLVDQFGSDVATILDLLENSSDLNQVLANPMIQAPVKKSILRQILSDQVHHYTLNFILLLVDRGRISVLAGVCASYQTLFRQLKGLVLAEITSALELTPDQLNQVSEKVKQMTNATGVDIKTQIDPTLLGGVVIKVGSQIVDASLRSQLRRIGMRLAGAIA